MAAKNTIIVGMHEAKTQLSKLMRRVEAGDEVIVSNAGRPVAKIVKYEPPKDPRKPGLWKGRIHVRENFDDPLPGFAIFSEQPAKPE